MPVAWPIRRLSSRQAHHLPIGILDEPLDDVAPNDTERTDNNRLILHTLSYWAEREAVLTTGVLNYFHCFIAVSTRMVKKLNL